VGHGRRNRLLYDDLDIFQLQGCISIVEQTSDMTVMRLMLAQLRSTMRDASFHGFESARYSYGIILSMLEDGGLTWADQFRIAEERRSALIARGSVNRAGPHVRLVRTAGVLVPAVNLECKDLVYAGFDIVDIFSVEILL
jgi:hypothetical protein